MQPGEFRFGEPDLPQSGAAFTVDPTCSHCPDVGDGQPQGVGEDGNIEFRIVGEYTDHRAGIDRGAP